MESEIAPAAWPRLIKQYRLERSLKQSALGELLGISGVAVSNWERGRDAPSPLLQERLTALLTARTPSASQRALYDLVEAHPQFAILLDLDGCILSTSRVYRDMFRYRPEDLNGQEFTRFAASAVGEAMSGDYRLRRLEREGVLAVSGHCHRLCADACEPLHAWYRFGLVRLPGEPPMVLNCGTLIEPSAYRPSDPEVLLREDHCYGDPAETDMQPSLPEDWGPRLRQYRRTHNMSQAQLADRMNVTGVTVGRWERGRDTPSLGLRPRLNALLALPPQTMEPMLRRQAD